MPPKMQKRIQALEREIRKLTLAAAAPLPRGPPPRPQRPGGARFRPNPPRVPRAPARFTAVPQQSGLIKISRTEMVTAVKAGSDGSASGTIKLQPDAFPFLKGLGKSFEKVRWSKIHCYWKPAGSLTTTGLIAVGVDWDAVDSFTAPNRESVLCYTPCISCPVREDCQKEPLKLPASRLRQMGWLTPDGSATSNPATRRPATLAYNLSSNIDANKLIGELYISYTVEMVGTRVTT